MIEQNRDAQLRTLLMTENHVDGSKLIPVLHFDGTPITARFIAQAIARHQEALAAPSRKVAS